MQNVVHVLHTQPLDDSLREFPIGGAARISRVRLDYSDSVKEPAESRINALVLFASSVKLTKLSRLITPFHPLGFSRNLD